MRNSYGGKCYRCGQYVEPGAGHFERIPENEIGQDKRQWRTQHATCAIKYRGTNVGKPNLPKRYY